MQATTIAELGLRLQQLEELVGDLQRRVDFVDAATSESNLNVRVQGSEAVVYSREDEAKQNAQLEERFQAMSTELQLNVAEMLQQVEKGLLSIQLSSQAQMQQTEAAVQGLKKRIEESLARGATELSDAAVASLLRQAEQSHGGGHPLASVAASAHSGLPCVLPPNEAFNVIRQQSTVSRSSSGRPSATIPTRMRSPNPVFSSPPTAVVAVSGMSSPRLPLQRPLQQVVSMPLRPSQPNVASASPRQQSRPGPLQAPSLPVPPLPGSPTASPFAASPQSYLATLEGIQLAQPLAHRGRSPEPHLNGRPFIAASRSPDSHFLRAASPDYFSAPPPSSALGMVLSPRSNGPLRTTSPPVTSRSSPWTVSASPRLPVQMDPGQWVKQTPAALLQPMPLQRSGNIL